MSYPLEAFRYVKAGTVAPGTVYVTTDGDWFMAVLIDQDRNGAIRLTRSEQGMEPGSVIIDPDHMVLAVTAPYRTSIRVDSISGLVKGNGNSFLGSILLAEPISIYCQDVHQRVLYGLNGIETDERSWDRFRSRYLAWSVHLVDEEGRDALSEPLVRVDVREKSEQP